VALGDSITGHMMSDYAAMIEHDLGVKVNPNNRLVGAQHSSELRPLLREDQYLQQYLSEAEVVTFNVPMRVFRDSFTLFPEGKCGGGGQSGLPAGGAQGVPSGYSRNHR